MDCRIQGDLGQLLDTGKLGIRLVSLVTAGIVEVGIAVWLRMVVEESSVDLVQRHLVVEVEEDGVFLAELDSLGCIHNVVIVPAESQLCSEKSPLAERNIACYIGFAVRSIDCDALILGSGHEKELVSKLEEIELLFVAVEVHVGPV